MTSIGWEYSAVDRASGRETPLYPSLDGSLSYDGGRDVSKTLTGLVLLPSESAKIDLGSDELRVWLVLDGVRHSMGFYTATESSIQKDVIVDPDTVSTPADVRTAGFGDRMARLIRSEGIPQYIQGGFDPVIEAEDLLLTEGIPFSFDGSASSAGETIVWDGGTTLLQKVVQLSELAGHRNPWMNNDGVVTSVLATVPNALDPSIVDVTEDLVVEADTLVVTENFLTAPNAVIVSGNSGGLLSPSVGRWDAPSIAPHSFSSRGYRYTLMVERQGVKDAAHAKRIATAIGERNSARTLDFQCVPTPILDGPVVLRYDDTLWVVQRWSVSTSPGGLMGVTAEELTIEDFDDPYNYPEEEAIPGG